MTNKEKKEAMEAAAYLLKVKATDEDEYNRLIEEGVRLRNRGRGRIKKEVGRCSVRLRRPTLFTCAA